MPAITKDEAIRALDALEQRIDSIHNLCCTLAPKQAVGESIAVAQKMTEWGIVRSAITEAAATQAAGAVYQFRQKTGLNNDWIECDARCEERMKAGPAADCFEYRTLYLAPTAPAAAPTDLSKRLREIAKTPAAVMYHHKGVMIQAADEIERYYGGMMAWKQTAEKKDADWNAERMARSDERCAARSSQAAPIEAVEVPPLPDPEYQDYGRWYDEDHMTNFYREGYAAGRASMKGNK